MTDPVPAPTPSEPEAFGVLTPRPGGAGAGSPPTPAPAKPAATTSDPTKTRGAFIDPSARMPDPGKTMAADLRDPGTNPPPTPVPSGATLQPGVGGRSMFQSSIRSSAGTMRGRTLVNKTLQQDVQNLDVSLQTSRFSVFSDLLAMPSMSSALGGLLERHQTDDRSDGRYRVEKELSAGGMGKILVIKDDDLGRREAMKIMLPELMNDAVSVQRFIEEAQITAQLEHPNIVPIHDLGVMPHGAIFFTMTLVGGKSLDAVIRALRERDPATVAQWTESERILTFLKVLDGVGFAHSRGVVHRDLKPANVMVGAHGEVFILDWGLAKAGGGADPTVKSPAGVTTRVTARAVTTAPAPAHAPAAPAAAPAQKPVDVITHRSAWPVTAATAPAPIDPAAAATPPPSDPNATTPAPTPGSGRGTAPPVGGELTQDGQAIGTPYYMPPEQALGDRQAIGQCSDIYSLGATLYDLLSLHKPIAGATTVELLTNVASGAVVPLEQVAPQLHPDLRAIVHKAMACQPADRYADTAAFAGDLRAYLDGRGVSARQLNLLERIGRFWARHRRRMQLAAGVAVLLAAAMTATWKWHQRGQIRQAGALVAEAQRLFAQTTPTSDQEEFRRLQLMVQQAEALSATTPGLRALSDEVVAGLRLAEARATQAIRQRERVEHSKTEWAEAERLLAAGALERGAEKLAAAFEINPQDRELLKRLEEVRIQVREQEINTMRACARQELDQGRALLDAAAKADPLDGALDERLRAAGEHFTLAGKDGYGPAGLDEQVVRFHTLDAAIRQQRDLHARQTAHAEALAAARKARAAEQWDEALAAVTRALTWLPGEATADALRLEVIEGRRAAIERQRQSQDLARRVQEAGEAVAKAADEAALYRQAADQLPGERQKMATLTMRLYDRPLAEKGPLWAAHAEVRRLETAQSEHWSLAERQANRALASLRDHPERTEATGAVAILRQLYEVRYHEAVQEGRLAQATVFSNLLRRLAEGGDTEGLPTAKPRLSLSGPAGAKVTVTRLEVGQDTRFTPVADSAIPLTLPVADLALEPGRYDLSGDGVRIALRLEAGATKAIAWPTALPTIPGMVLRYVPPDGAAPGFMLGDTEITHEQYWYFVHDPEILEQARTSWRQVAEFGAEHPNLELVFLPRTTASSGLVWQAFTKPDDAGRLISLNVPKALEHEPVVGVNRRDAEAFCAWLGRKTGLRCRLPRFAERRRAADGGDGERLFPWGSVFDPSFAVCAFSRRKEPMAVAANETDVGPYGHHDLAGNVREWLGDRPGDAAGQRAAVHGALVAGGAWSDEQEAVFRTSYAESIPPESVNAAIGFRILVELP